MSPVSITGVQHIFIAFITFSSILIRIAHGNSPEEVARWREERRSKFPTKAVVEEKMARQKELKERGEVGDFCLLLMLINVV